MSGNLRDDWNLVTPVPQGFAPRSSTTRKGWLLQSAIESIARQLSWSQGMAALEMLNIMETSQPSPDGPLSIAELHKKIEAMKLAHADLER